MKCIIKEIGLAKNINVSEFCRWSGMSRTEYYNIINNVKEPKLTNAFYLVREANSHTGYVEWLSIEDLFVYDYIYDLVISHDVDKLKRSAYDRLANYIDTMLGDA